MPFRRRIWVVFLVVMLTFLAGIIGYEAIEGWDLLDSTYMTVITLATIGYGETHPLSDPGRVFTIFLILGGITSVSYGALTLTSLVADGELFRLLRRKRMNQAIAKLQNHFIVCGAGKTGEHAIVELLQARKPVVVIDKDQEHLRKFQTREALVAYFGQSVAGCEVFYIEGDASQDKILFEASIERAEGIVCALTSDKDNVFVVLTARGLNSRIRIVSKCEDDESEQKLVRAGADRIVSPTRIGGLRMASEMVRPTVVSFLDYMVRDPQGYRFEEIVVEDRSPFVGQAMRQSPLGSAPDIRVVALANQKDGYSYNPTGDTVLSAGLRLVVLGRSEEVERLRKALRAAS